MFRLTVDEGFIGNLNSQDTDLHRCGGFDVAILDVPL
jgi:hypothetical protein